MMTTDSIELLRCYTNEQSEAAFTALVERHVDLVYAAALRQVNGDDQAAQDVTQAVFTDLARKARQLTQHPSLTGWLYTSTRYLAAKVRRTEQRRRNREQEAHEMNQLLSSTESNSAWCELGPVLDEAMHDLSATDRDAMLLRFFEQCSLAEVGGRLGLTENAAQMRVQRALDKLRIALAKRGVTSTTAALAAVLTANVTVSAPASLAGKVGHAAIAAAAAGGLPGVLASLLASTKAKLLIGGAAAVIIAGSLLLSKPADQTQHNASVTPVPAETIQAKDENSPAAVAALATVVTVSPATSTTLSSNRLVLTIVAADSDRPIPGVVLDYWLWSGEGSIHKQPLFANRFGVCEVPVPRATVTQLMLVSQMDGFADTRLEWRPDRGEQIPEDYTLRVARSVTIGGLVVDPDNQPVAGAQVGFGKSSYSDTLETRPQSDNFGSQLHVKTLTDADGRWRIDRFSRAAISAIVGVANHSNYISSRVEVSESSPEAEQLLAGTYVFKLGSAGIVRGLVVDTNGQPVAGATVRVGFLSESGGRETTSLEDGRFSVAGCRPGQNLLSAEAKGFASTTIDVDLSDKSGPYTLTLQRGNLLRLRVVNRAGQPVPKAQVWLNPFESGPIDPTGNKRSPVQTEFNRQTDAEGRLEWDSAPDADLRFDVSASGYMRISDVLVRPDGQEHIITLPPALTISGTVCDAATGQLIPRFRIITGWPEWNPTMNTTNAQWSPIDRFRLSFDGGKFHHVYEVPVLGNTPNPGFKFKFEADGYAPSVTRSVPADEGEVQFNIALRPAATTSVTVLQPDGRPAAQADVGLVSPGARLLLAPGGFSRIGARSKGSLLTTDAQGRFVLPPDDAVTLVIAADVSGYAEASPVALTTGPTIRLQPWGRIEGNYVVGGEPAGGRSVLFTCKDGDFNTISSDFVAYQAKTDEAGRFVFAQVPPGMHKLAELVPTMLDPGSMGWTHKPLTSVKIRPGETTAITVGSTNSVSGP